VDAVQKLLKDGYKGKVTEETIRSYLYLPDLPDPDLIIRTSGEYRLSNFWLWEGSYSEFYFSSLLWPDFNKEALQEAILSYEKRDRRYGGIQR
jgi:undecaprenyl diphosphate synthase